MKKLIYLLLLVYSGIFAQVSTGQEQDFDYGIKNNSSQQILTPDTLVTKGADGTYGHTSAYRLPLSTATKDSINTKIASNAGLQNAYNFEPEIVTSAIKGAVAIRRGSAADTDNILVGQNGAGTNTFSVTGAGNITGGTYNGYTPANDANVVKLTNTQDIDGVKNLKQRLGFIRSLDNTPAASIGYEDTGFNFSIDAGGGSSYVSFKNAHVEVGRFNSTTGGLLVNKTLGTVGYKFEVEGKGAFSSNLNAKNFSDLAGKRWVIFGDSFSNDLVNDYVGTVRDNLDMTAVTYAVSGDVSAGQLSILKAQILANPNFLNNFDIISLHIGVNDQSNGTIPLGSVKSVIGDGSVSANIKEFIEVALAANPIIKVFIITPPEADGGTSGRTYKSYSGFGGWSLEMLSTTISSICKYYSVQCVDLYSLSQFNLKTIPTLTSDGLHPSFPVGTKWIGDIVSRAFVSNNSSGVSVVSNESTTGYVPKINTNSTFSNSNLFYNGANLGLGTLTASTPFDVNGVINTNTRYTLNNGTQSNQMFSGGLVFTGGVAADIGIRNDAGKILFGAGSSAIDMVINTNGVINIPSLAGSEERVISRNAAGDLIISSAPTAPTPTAGDNSTKIATTAFVLANTQASIPQLEYNNTDLTVWNNGKGNISSNTSFGSAALNSNTTGSGNTAIGANALDEVSTNSNNTGLGTSAMQFNNSGSDNVAVGYNAGRFDNLGDGINQAQSVLIGSGSKGTRTSTNEIAIGYNVQGSGSNTATIGNASITKTVLRGVIQQTTYTVATLPAGAIGQFAIVTDAVSPTYLGTLTGGGSVVCPVFYNGTAWVSH